MRVAAAIMVSWKCSELGLRISVIAACIFGPWFLQGRCAKHWCTIGRDRGHAAKAESHHHPSRLNITMCPVARLRPNLTRSAGERSWLSTLAPVEHTLVDYRRESGRDRIWRYFNIVSLSDMAGTSFA